MDGQLFLFGALFLYGFVVSPALAVYCWARWYRSKRRASRKARWSLAALALASLALVVGVAAVASSSMRHGSFLTLAASAHWLYLPGIATSALACFCGVVGALQSNPLRLKALAVALGAAVFWFLAGSAAF